MWRMWLVTAVAVLIAASVVVGWAAKLTVNGGTLQAFTYPVDLGPVVATIDIDPDTLNPDSEGNFVMAYIELPQGYDVADVDVSTVTLEVEGAYGSVPADLSPTEVGDHDADGIPDRMVKFDRAAVLGLIDGESGDVTFVVAGELVDGQAFKGTDTVTLIGGLGSAGLAAAGDTACTGPLGPCADYEVQPGDTLWDIGARFGTTVEALAQLNGLEDCDVILYGSTLNVPYVGDEPAEGNESDRGQEAAVPDRAATPVDGPSSEGELEPDEADCHDCADSGAEDAESAASREPPSAPRMRAVEYEVQPGETLVDIAARFGTSVEALAQVNGLEDPDVVLYGSTLNVPYVGEDGGGAAADVSR